MSVTVETLENLERKIVLTLPWAAINAETDKRLQQTQRRVKIDGFRPGKAPLKMVESMYGAGVQNDVMNEQVQKAFYDIAVSENLKVAGMPRFEGVEEQDDQEAFKVAAIFEVFPEVAVGDLAAQEIEKVTAEVGDAEIDKTIEILRQQRTRFNHVEREAQNGDRVIIDFEGKIDDVAFDGGSSQNYPFVLGNGQMLPEFEAGVLGLKAGESKDVEVSFPEDYHGKDVAGKTADFLVTVKKIEAAHLPEVNDALAKSLGVAEPTVEGLRADIKKNLEREVKFRLLNRNKQAVMEALVAKAQLDLPNAAIQAEIERLRDGARADLKQRGLKDADKAEIPDDIFRPQAEHRVRLGLVLAELVRANNLQATPEQLKAHIDELAASYEKPEDVVRWYFSDRQRLADVEAVVVENNVTDFVLSKVKVTDKTLSFEELMGQQA